MNYWPLATEVIALLIICIILAHHHLGNRYVNKQNTQFRLCLIISAVSIVWNMLTFLLLGQPEVISIPIYYFINSGYFIVEFFLCTILFGTMLFERVLEHVYNPVPLKRTKQFLRILFGFYLVLVIVNLKTGILFWLDESKIYHQGPLNKIGHVIVIFELALLLICFFRYSKNSCRSCRGTLGILTPSLIVLVIIQLVNPDFQMNGSMIAVIDLIMYINYQAQQKQIDSVTDLGNRNDFFDELNYNIIGQRSFQVVLFTITDFTKINRRYGHEKGNEFLYSISTWLTQTFPECTAFRFIGVSFVLIAPYKDADHNHTYLEKIAKRFESPWSIGDVADTFQIGIGDYIHENTAHSANDIMEILDYLLSEIKHSKTSHVHFNKMISDEFLEHVKISTLLRSENAKYQVWYQPIYDRKRQSFSCAEALIRLQDNEGNYISPNVFIPIAEELGIIDDIFWFVFKESCSFLNKHPELPLKTISVNMALPQFENPNLLSQMIAIIQKYNLKPYQIKLEITERILSDNHVKASQIIQQIHLAGFTFSLDDFGTGYSNFASVVQLPLQTIKLDKSLVSIWDKDSRNKIMLSKIIELFHNFDMSVVAEGIETEEMLDALSQVNADYLQGFYYARPMPAENLLEFYEA